MLFQSTAYLHFLLPKLTWSQYADIDESESGVQTLTDEDIVSLVQRDPPSPVQTDSDSDDTSLEAPRKVTTSDALNAVNVLRQYWLQEVSADDNCMRSLEDIEETIYRL